MESPGSRVLQLQFFGRKGEAQGVESGAVDEDADAEAGAVPGDGSGQSQGLPADGMVEAIRADRSAVFPSEAGQRISRKGAELDADFAALGSGVEQEVFRAAAAGFRGGGRCCGRLRWLRRRERVRFSRFLHFLLEYPASELPARCCEGWWWRHRFCASSASWARSRPGRDRNVANPSGRLKVMLACGSARQYSSRGLRPG